ARLFRSAKIVGMPMRWTPEELNEAQKEVIRRNGLEAAYIRPMVFYGSEGMGLHAEGLSTHAIVAAWPWGTYLGEEALKRGIRVKTSSFVRHHVNAAMCKAKVNGHYVNSMLAVAEAARDGYDEALLLDPDGYVAEGSGENIFIVKNGALFTPELTNALDGITRATVMELARDAGIPVHEKRITRDEVYTADEAFFTGTAAEITPIRELDGRTIGAGRRGPITERLQALYFDAVHGRIPERRGWLAYV
ncbi:MAG: branched-chain amino acid transaminase, partial [Zetaproteobacteria bacterium]